MGKEKRAARDPKKLYPHDYIFKYTLIPLIPRIVTPNGVTWLRFFLIPFVIYFVEIQMWEVAVPLFMFAAFTDALDGSLARVTNRITEWGMFYDPLADKLLVGSVVLLIVAKYINVYFAIIIITLEVLIMGAGYIRKKRGKILPSNIFGKTKMFFQVVGVTCLLIAAWAGVDMFVDVSIGTLSLAIVFAVVSLFTYGI